MSGPHASSAHAGAAGGAALLLVHGGLDHARNWDWVARSLRQREFVLAARSLGAKSRRIIFRELLPNVLLPVLSFAFVGVALLIVTALFRVIGPRNTRVFAQILSALAGAAVFLSFAAPGVPRGAFIMLTPLFLAIGLPAEGVGLLIAVDALPDVFSTVLNVTGDMAAAAILGRGEGSRA